MNTPLFQQISRVSGLNHAKTNTAILKAILTLAETYDKANDLPNIYAKYGYDFPEMIKMKVMNLEELNYSCSWINSFYNSLLNSLDSPKEIISLCNQYLREMCQNSQSHTDRKEYAYAYK